MDFEALSNSFNKYHHPVSNDFSGSGLLNITGWEGGGGRLYIEEREREREREGEIERKKERKKDRKIDR